MITGGQFPTRGEEALHDHDFIDYSLKQFEQLTNSSGWEGSPDSEGFGYYLDALGCEMSEKEVVVMYRHGDQPKFAHFVRWYTLRWDRWDRWDDDRYESY